MLLYHISKRAAAKEHATMEQNTPVLTHEEIDELLKQLEEEVRPAPAESQDDPYL